MASEEHTSQDLEVPISHESFSIQLSDGQVDQGMISVAVDSSTLQGLTMATNDPGSQVEDTQDDDGEPVAKRQKITIAEVTAEGGHSTVNQELSQDQSIKQLLFTINKAICMRLDGIENSIEILSGRTKYLEEKLDEVVQYVKTPSTSVVSPGGAKKGAVIVGLPQGNRENGPGVVGVDSVSNMGLGPNVTLITLNSEGDFPNGTWLGDDTNPEMRVRVPITPSDLLHIHSNCRTAEKMALTMLDYLFDRETQATSNLSGMGKHGKKQLDPLMIYGVRCHLIHRFNVNEGDWHRIKQNIDSKCRTAFRRKQRGMPLSVKAFRGKQTPTFIQMGNGEEGYSDEDSMQDGELRIHQVSDKWGDLDLKQTVAAMQSEGLPTGEIQILHATPEQISQLQQAHHIQILQGDQVIQVPMPVNSMGEGDENQEMQVVSMSPPDSVQVTTENGHVQVTNANGQVIHMEPSEPEITDS